ncbi:MAG: glycosyltransferase family 4 protein, partial [Candidatus Altiarchaeota archaeon]
MTSSLAGLRVLKIAPSVFSPAKMSSGIKTYTLTLKRHLEDRGVRVDLLAASLNGGRTRGQHSVRIPRKSDVLFSLYVIAPYLRMRNQYDLIHSSDPFLSLPLLLKLTRKPSVITLHEFWSEAVSYKRGFLSGILAGFIERTALMRATRVIAVDDKIREKYVEKYPFLEGKIHSVDVGVDLDYFKPLSRSPRERFGLGRD